MTKFLTRSFVNGLLLVAPLAITAFAVYKVVTVVDRLIGVSVPGLGIVIVLALIVVVGAVVSNVVGQRLVQFLERSINRLPIIKLLYGSIRDLFGAFVGEQKTFTRPVMVELVPGSNIKALGFVTAEQFDDPALLKHVAVYLPQSYNVAGNLVLVPRSQVHNVDAEGAQFLAFVMSGGVTSMNAAKTMLNAEFTLPHRPSQQPPRP